MAPDAVLCADVGQNQIWSANYFEVREGRFLTSGGMGTMGYSIPCAVGAKSAAPGRQVCAVCGDGSFQMSMMELGTICQEALGVKIVVMRNTRLGMVRELQDNLYDGVHSGVYLDGSPDFVRLAGGVRNSVRAPCPPMRRRRRRSSEHAAPTTGPTCWQCDVQPGLSLAVTHPMHAGSVIRRQTGLRAMIPLWRRRNGASHEIHHVRAGGKPSRRPVQGVRPVFPPRLQYRFARRRDHGGSDRLPYDHRGGRGRVCGRAAGKAAEQGHPGHQGENPDARAITYPRTLSLIKVSVNAGSPGGDHARSPS